jgi:hypothetical protein
MKNRSPIAVFFLPFVTFGIYGLVWQVKTKGEMNRLGAGIPTAWLLIVPLVNIWWLWKYSEGVEKVTNGGMSGVLAFVLLFLLGVVGMAIIQNEFNKVAASAAAPAVGSGQPLPDNSFGGPAPAVPASPPPEPTQAPIEPTAPPPPHQV